MSKTPSLRHEAGEPRLDDANAMDRIAAILHQREWSPDDLDAIAEIVRNTDRPVEDKPPPPCEATPGPWEYQDDHDANMWRLTTDDQARWLAAVQQNGEFTVERQRANMRLMAAAPDLLSVLTDVEVAFENEEASVQQEHSDLIDRIEAVIKKALGK